MADRRLGYLYNLQDLLETTPLLYLSYSDPHQGSEIQESNTEVLDYGIKQGGLCKFSYNKVLLKINSKYKFDSIKVLKSIHNTGNDISKDGIFFMCTPDMIANKLSYYDLISKYIFTESDLESQKNIANIYNILLENSSELNNWTDSENNNNPQWESFIKQWVNDYLEDTTMLNILKDKRSLRTLNYNDAISYLKNTKIELTYFDAIHFANNYNTNNQMLKIDNCFY